MTVYWQDWKSLVGTIRFYYDDTKKVRDAFGIVNKDQPGAKGALEGEVASGNFLGTDLRIYRIQDNPLYFFTDYIPRVFGFTARVHKVDAVTDIPDPGRRKPLPESLKLKYGIKD